MNSSQSKTAHLVNGKACLLNQPLPPKSPSNFDRYAVT
jgi:hypothetical protein